MLCTTNLEHTIYERATAFLYSAHSDMFNRRKRSRFELVRRRNRVCLRAITGKGFEDCKIQRKAPSTANERR